MRKGGKASDIKTVIMWCFAKQNALGVFLHSRKLHDIFPAFIKGAEKEFPKAQIVFDKFHVMKILNEQHIRTQKTNALLEGLNSKLRVLTKRAFGFKRFDYLKTTIFMCLDKLDFPFEPV